MKPYASALAVIPIRVFPFSFPETTEESVSSTIAVAWRFLHLKQYKPPTTAVVPNALPIAMKTDLFPSDFSC